MFLRRRLAILNLAGSNIDNQLSELIRIARAFWVLCHAWNMALLRGRFHIRQEPIISNGPTTGLPGDSVVDVARNAFDDFVVKPQA